MNQRLLDQIDQVIYELGMGKKSLICYEGELLQHHVERALRQIKELDIDVYNMNRTSGVPYRSTPTADVPDARR